MDGVLTINVGSSSVRLALVRGGVVELERHSGPAAADAESALLEFVRDCGGEIRAVAHRMVHGGTEFRGPAAVDDGVAGRLSALAPLAPLHMPGALAWLAASRSMLRGVPQVACFDTGFFADLPQAAAVYGIPRDVAGELGIRRYGFHGIAHGALWRQWCRLRPDRGGRGRVVTLQLGSGCSVAAVVDGRAVDTSMGFSPLEGLLMATRCGDLDPGALLHVMRKRRLGVDELERMLQRESGLLGVSGISGDMRELLASREPSAELAVAMFCHRVRKTIGAYAAVMGGLDAVLFGGGIGEHSAAIRGRSLEGLAFLGLSIDAKANQTASGDSCITAPGSVAEAWVIRGREAEELARMALETLDGRRRGDE